MGIEWSTLGYNYTKSLVNDDLFYANFTNMAFQKIPIPHLTRMYYETEIPSLTRIYLHVVLTNRLTWLTRILLNTTFSKNQK